MHPILRIMVLPGLLTTVSCTQQAAKAPEPDALYRSLTYAERQIQDINATFMAAMEDRVMEPENRERAELFLPCTQAAGVLCKALSDSLNGLPPGAFSEEGINRQQLSASLNHLQQQMLALHEIVKRDFGGFDFVTGAVTAPAGAANDLHSLTSNDLRYLRQQLRLNIGRHLNRVLALFLEQAHTVRGCGYTSFSAIVVQNSNALLPREKLEISAGVGSFSTLNRPRFTINGKVVPVEGDGQAHSSLAVPKKPGSYAVPVSISFTDQDGKEMTVSKVVEYRVLSLPATDTAGSKGPH